MKNLLRFAVLFLVLGVLFSSNPDEDAFRSYIQDRVETQIQDDAGDGSLGRLLTDLGSSIVGSLAARVSERQNFLIFSLYSVDVGADGDPGESWRFLGIGGRFFELHKPNSES